MCTGKNVGRALKKLAEISRDGVAAIGAAHVFDANGLVQKLREKLLPRIGRIRVSTLPGPPLDDYRSFKQRGEAVLQANRHLEFRPAR